MPEVVSASRQFDEKQTDLAQKHDELQKKQAELNTAKGELAKAEKQHQKETQDLIDALLKRTQTLEEEIKDLTATIQQSQTELNTLKKQLQAADPSADTATSASSSVDGNQDKKTDASQGSIPDDGSSLIQSVPVKPTDSQTGADKPTSPNTPRKDTDTNPDSGSASTLEVDSNADTQAPQETPAPETATPQSETPSAPVEAAPIAPVVAPSGSETGTAPVESTTPVTNLESQVELSETEKMQKVIDILQKLSAEIQPNQQNQIFLSSAQLAAFDQVESYLTPRQQLILDKKSRKEYIRDLKDQIKAEKKATKDLQKIAKLEAELANAKNENNYHIQKISTLDQINAILETGQYLNTPLAFLNSNPLILDLYKNRWRLKTQPVLHLQLGGRPVEVFSQATVQGVGNVAEYVQSCGGYANVAEKRLAENTKMSHAQARNAVNTLTTVGMIGAGFFALKKLFGETDKNGNWSFKFSFSKILAAIGIPMLANYASQAATGEGFLTHLSRAWKEGRFPWDEKTVAQATPYEQMAIRQSTAQMVLLGVPYAQLAQMAKPKTWPMQSLDLSKLKTYYQEQLAQAKATNDTEQEQILGSQLKAVEAMIADPSAQQLLQTALQSMQIESADFADPNKANQNLNEVLAERNQNMQALDTYLQTHQLRINPLKKSELEQKVFASSKMLEKSDFGAFLKEGLLMPNDQFAQEFDKLSIDPQAKQKFHEAVTKLTNKADFSNIKLDVLEGEKIKLTSDGREITINAKTLKLPGFHNAGGQEIPFGSPEELLHTALLVNKIKADLRTLQPDSLKKSDVNWPFDLSSGVDVVLKGLGSIVFKKHGNATELVLSDQILLFSKMDWDFPTIEAGENRNFFVQYLNQLWKQDHPS